MSVFSANTCLEDFKAIREPEGKPVLAPEQRIWELQNKHMLIYRVSANGQRIRRRCVGCYSKLRLHLDRIEARKKTKCTSLYCPACVKQPTLCLICFNERHVTLELLPKIEEK